MVRLYVEADLACGAPVDLSSDQARYVGAVMRLTLGADLIVFNGRDGEWAASLTHLDKRSARITPRTRLRAQPAPPELELILALIKRSALEWAVEKATELGVGRIRLVATQRSVADHTNVSRLLAIATEAAEQCERLDVPTIDPPVRLDRFIAAWPIEARLLFCDEALARVSDETAQALDQVKTVLEAATDEGFGRLAVLIGPEGGFDPVERAGLLGLSAVRPVTLGPRILRAETAVVVALAVIQAGLAQRGRA
jgi:16S rRNA (uracil1498-N3)-methyltransferase